MTHTHLSNDVADSGSVGRMLLRAGSEAEARALLGLKPRRTWIWDPAIWKDISSDRRSFGFRVWLSGAELRLGKLLFRARWISR